MENIDIDFEELFTPYVPSEYHDVVGWWKNKQKFFINMDTLISMKEFSEIIE